MTPDALRIAAAVAAGLLVVSLIAPHVGGLVSRLAAARARLRPAPAGPGADVAFADDQHVVLDLAARLQAAGRVDAAAAARKLLEALLVPTDRPTDPAPPSPAPEVRA